MRSEILRYIGHGGEVTAQLETLINLCQEKLASVNDPRHVIRQFPCTVTNDGVTIDTLNIKSKGLAIHLNNCTQVYLLAATLGADVDRLITQRSKIDNAEALCIQACAAAQIEDYCSSIEGEVSHKIRESGLYPRYRFSPGYSDFDISTQTEILNILQTHKIIGLTETKSHMLTPLKSITAIIGVSPTEAFCTPNKCETCDKPNCNFRQREGFSCLKN